MKQIFTVKIICWCHVAKHSILQQWFLFPAVYSSRTNPSLWLQAWLSCIYIPQGKVTRMWLGVFTFFHPLFHVVHNIFTKPILPFSCMMTSSCNYLSTVGTAPMLTVCCNVKFCVSLIVLTFSARIISSFFVCFSYLT